MAYDPVMTDASVPGDVAMGDPDGETTSPWDKFVRWAKRLYADPHFDEAERDYKLEIAARVAGVREQLRAGNSGWQTDLKRSFGAPNNLTYFIVHSQFLAWVETNLADAERALLSLWDGPEPTVERVQAFCDTLRATIASPGARLQIATFLLLADPEDNPMYRPSPFKKAAHLVGYPPFPGSPDGAIYEHALEFIDEFLRQSRIRNLELRDRLDAQSIIWALTKTAPGSFDGWSSEEIDALLRYRGDRRSAWWVNQGANFHKERDLGIVTAPVESKGGYVLQHHLNVSQLKDGDVIVHYANGKIRAVSVVKDKPYIGMSPIHPDGVERRLCKTTYFELEDPIEIGEIPEAIRIGESPFAKDGVVKQVYLVNLDSTFADWLKETFATRWPEGSPWEHTNRATWLFQANPKVWNLEEHLSAMEIGGEDVFSVTRYKSEIAEGDRVLLWSAGANAGIYGVATIVGELFESDEDEHFNDSGDKTKVPWQLDRVLDAPILRTDLLDHPVLKGLSVITSPQGTNFRVTDEQWAEIQQILDGVGDESHGSQDDLSLADIATHIANQGLIISERTLRRFHVSLMTRGFVILSGISGTGKTWLTEAYAEAAGTRYLLVPVAPNWTTNEDLLGYLNPIDGVYHDTVFSRFLRDAADEYETATREQRRAKTFILTLDEMNLARVEYYFAKFLSAMEVRMRRGTADLELAPNQSVRLVPNLLFIGTVNVDETTHGFADKVFDRAQLIELEAPREAIAEHIGTAAFRESLLDVYDCVVDAKPFGFRVVDEVRDYVAESDALDVEWRDAIDEQILQKVLTKFNGADPSLKFALERLIDLASDKEFILTEAKAKRMLHDYNRDGFTTYF